MSARDAILGRIRTALGRNAGSPAPELESPLLRIPEVDINTRVQMFSTALEKLSGKTYVASSPGEARDAVLGIINEQSFVSSNSPLVERCGLAQLVPADRHRDACASVAFGVTGAAFALADTGTLVMMAGSDEARLTSLLPPVHIAIIERAQILTGLDELLSNVPLPADLTSSMVLITGPSRTADIEQILVRGVHGPGELHVVIV